MAEKEEAVAFRTTASTALPPGCLPTISSPNTPSRGQRSSRGRSTFSSHAPALGQPKRGTQDHRDTHVQTLHAPHPRLADASRAFQKGFPLPWSGSFLFRLFSHSTLSMIPFSKWACQPQQSANPGFVSQRTSQRRQRPLRPSGYTSGVPNRSTSGCSAQSAS